MLCRFWQQGNCRYADQCRYSHGDAGATAPKGVPPTEVCSYFLAGYCRFGTECRSVHVGAGDGWKGKSIKAKGGKGRGKGGGKFEPKSGGQGFKNKVLINGKGPALSSGAADASSITEKALTGPYLGKGSELAKVWSMPENEGHEDGIACAVVMADRLCTGGHDQKLLLWRGNVDGASLALQKDNELSFAASVTSILFHEASRWFFVGLADGQLKGFCQAPSAEASLSGHTAPVTSLLLHETVLLSGSEDCSVRAWRPDGATGKFDCVGTIQCPTGPVYSLHVQAQHSGFWIGGQQGIAVVNMQSLQCTGNIQSAANVVGLLPFEGSIIAAFADGVVKVFGGDGSEKFSHGPLGEHTTNTAVSLVHHPHVNKTILLCGQELGYVTAYELPEFTARGTFSTGYEGDVTTIVAMGDGLFATCGLEGDVVLWWRRCRGA